METIGAWTWLGAIAVQNGVTFDIIFESKTNKASAGSTLYDMQNTVLRLRCAPVADRHMFDLPMMAINNN